MTRDSELEPGFWRRKSLDHMSRDEWEALCDGCGHCCRMKLEDQEYGDLLLTEIVCKLLDLETCRCTDYPNRQRRVPGCLQLSPDKLGDIHWLPPTCGYKLVAAGRDLEWWHPLVSGDPESVHRAGVSVRGEVISEREIDDVQAFLERHYGVELAED